MKVLQINAVYGQGSTGTIVRDIERLCEQNGIECYVASPDQKVCEAKRHYVIGNWVDHKAHAIFSRIYGKQAYYSHIPTKKFLHWIDEISPEIVHLHNLHSNYIHLNMLLDYLAKKDIKTIVTMHDCWFYTGGCFHYTVAGCTKWLSDCSNCPKKKSDTPAYLTKKSAQILADRKKYLLAIPHLYVTGVSEWMAHEALNTFF
ncbi:MAG: glycosyltransferase [Alistipes putredinis]|nr:MAG: glycosyltransferase [Alistipes putredinis]